MARPKKDKNIRNTLDQRGWGSTSQEVAPEPLPVEAIVLPAADKALEVLQSLAESNQRVVAAKLKYDEAAARAKQLKGKYDELSQALSRLLHDATHGSKTPLLDAAEGEADLARMERAIEAMQEGPDLPQDASSPESDGGSGPNDTVNASGGDSGGSNVLAFIPAEDVPLAEESTPEIF